MSNSALSENLINVGFSHDRYRLEIWMECSEIFIQFISISSMIDLFLLEANEFCFIWKS